MTEADGAKRGPRTIGLISLALGTSRGRAQKTRRKEAKGRIRAMVTAFGSPSALAHFRKSASALRGEQTFKSAVEHLICNRRGLGRIALRFHALAAGAGWPGTG